MSLLTPNLIKALNEFRRDGSNYLCGVRIRWNDELFPVHRVVLLLRAQVLQDFLDINYLDHIEDDEIVIDPHVDETFVKNVLEYVYLQIEGIPRIPAA